MSATSRAALKAWFETGDTPTEAQFASLIDSFPNIVDDFADKYVKVEVSSADIKQFNSSPKLLVAAPGAGKILVATASVTKYTYGTVPYATSTAMGIDNDNLTFLHIDFGNDAYSGSVDRISYGLATAASGHIYYDSGINVNKGLYATNQSADPTAGDGTLTIYLWYKEITL